MLHKKISFPDSFRLFFLRAKKAGWAASEGFVSPILQLALTPFLLHELGKFEFGTWVLVLTFWSLGPLLSFAAAAATFNRLSEQVAGNNEKSVVDTLRTGALLGIFATLSSGVVVAIIYAIYAFQYGVAVEYKFLSTLIFLAGVALLLQELDGVFSSALKAHSRFDLSAKIDIFFRVVWVGTVALAAAGIGTALACVSCGVVVSIFKVVVRFIFVRKIIDCPFALLPLPQRLWDKNLFVLASWNWGQAVGGNLFNAADKFLVGALFGVEVLSSYAICSQIAQFVHGVQASAAQVLLPWANKCWTSATEDTLRKFHRVAFWGGVACLALPLAVAAAMPTVLGLWIGSDFARDNVNLAYALLLGYALLSSNIPLHYILLGGGGIKILTTLNLIGGVASILIGFWLAGFGVTYFALSKCIYSPVTLLAVTRLRIRNN